MDNNIKRILIVDDEEKITEVVKSYLEKGGYAADTAHNGSQALEICERALPSLIILDLMLPDINGEDLCKKIRERSQVPIIMLTAKVEEEDILRGLDIGADDYVTKPFSPRQLVARVAALLRRVSADMAPQAGPVSFDNGSLTVDILKHEVKRDGEVINLTPAEFKLLSAFIKHPARVYTREELIMLVFGEDFEGYDRTIDTHIKNLRQKLERDSRNPKYITTVYGVGYRFGGG